MVHAYCKTLGLDQPRREEYLALLELSSANHKLAEVLQSAVIAPNVEPIVERFYDFLLSHAEFSRFLQGREMLARLKHTQSNYLRTLGVEFHTADYFEQRLRVGMAHKRIGLPLRLYQCAYRLLQQLILDMIPGELAEGGVTGAELATFVHKITALDISLAIEIYHAAQVTELQKSLEELRGEEVELRTRALTDGLTGLANRDHSLSVLRVALQNARRWGGPLSIIMADLDLFKQVNDSYGHLVGDQLLRDIAARIESAVRSFDTVGRYGGEEFVIVLVNTPLELARQIAERVRRRIADTPVNLHDKEIRMTISQGLATAVAGDDVHTLIQRADEALYRAKEAGRNCVVVHESHAAGS